MTKNEMNKRLVAEIKASKMSTIELGKKLGVSSEMVTQYCTQGKMPSYEVLAKLCALLDISSDYILGLTDY